MTYALVLMDDHRDWLTAHRYDVLTSLPVAPDLTIEHVDTEQRGFTHQMRALWQQLRGIDVDHVLLWEADFTPAGLVPLEDMARILEADPRLAQVALVRQPWFHNEHQAGGLLASLEKQGVTLTARDGYLEHNGGWTNNPCLFPAWIARENPWPDTAWSEAQFGRKLLSGGYRCAYYGARDDLPRVIHHGIRTEASHGY